MLVGIVFVIWYVFGFMAALVGISWIPVGARNEHNEARALRRLRRTWAVRRRETEGR
jgi:hypothetical protein